MAKLRRLKFEHDAPRCRGGWFSWSIGSRGSREGYKQDRYSCHRTKTAAVNAFQKRCKPGTSGVIGITSGSKGSWFEEKSTIKCKRSK
jgi:hypothetical protein